MSDREPRDNEEDFTEIEPGLAGGSGGSFLMSTDSPIHHGRRPEVGVTEQDDYTAPEGDDELLNPGSPEFEHLTRPVRREEKP